MVATATGASGQSWGGLRLRRPTWPSSPTTIRAPSGPATVRAEILAEAPGAREIGDRAEAIRPVVAMLGPGDVLLVAGKGHETGQIVGDKVLPFSDQEEILKAIAEAGHG